jgi:hypothetical protein
MVKDDQWGYTNHTWLVVWNMNFIFPFSWESHHPNWRTPSFFRGVGSTTNQFFFLCLFATYLRFAMNGPKKTFPTHVATGPKTWRPRSPPWKTPVVVWPTSCGSLVGDRNPQRWVKQCHFYQPWLGMVEFIQTIYMIILICCELGDGLWHFVALCYHVLPTILKMSRFFQDPDLKIS